MEDFDLLCCEDGSFLSDQEDHEPYFPPELDDEYMLSLVGKEASLFQSQNRAIKSFSLDSSVRLDALRWIVCKKWVLGFHFRTAYLSMVYLDHLISKRVVDIEQQWTVPASMVACLSLAAKMEEGNPPALSRYEVDGGAFNGVAIRRMELTVMKALEWKMDPITPFAYLDYFVSKFFPDTRPKKLTKATELIMALIEEINLVDHRPSAIAAAAVFVAYNDFLTRDDLESKITEISLWGSLEKEHIRSCYNLLQQEMQKNKTPAPSNLPQKRSSTEDVSANPSSRRKLTFNVSDQHCPTKKTPRSS